MTYARIALAILALLPITAPATESGAETTGTGSPETIAVASSAIEVHQPRETPDRHDPWAADYPATTTVEGHLVYAESHRQVELVETALSRFSEAGLALPRIEFWMHDTTAGCVSNDGGLRAGYLINRNGWTIFQCGTEFTLLHELAHVWDNHELADDERDAFLSVRKADAWSGVKWNRAGGEHLADVVAWGLTGGAVRPSRTLPNDDASLAAAYELALTFAG
ncbi:MAG: hypothetical protein ACE5GC_06710 [Acidimicrobiia bacterium]